MSGLLFVDGTTTHIPTPQLEAHYCSGIEKFGRIALGSQYWESR
jgi:hypothetical protein